MLSDSATDRVAERVASLPKIDNLEQRLASAMERTIPRSDRAAVCETGLSAIQFVRRCGVHRRTPDVKYPNLV
jgi:hypothetical protein